MNEQQARRVQKLMKINLKAESPPDPIIRLANDSIVLDTRINGKSDKEVIDILIAKEDHDAKSIGLMYHILTSGENTDLFSRMIRYINGGGVEYWHTVLCNMNMTLFECWPFIHLICKEQLLRLIREAVRQNVKQIENVLMNAYRMALGLNDFITKQRIFIKLAKIVRDHEPWFRSHKSCAALVANIITCTTYVIVSSPSPMSKDDTFRDSMIDLVQWVIRARKTDCLTLGRDFILIMIRLGKTPQMEEIFRDFLMNPTSYGVGSVEEYLAKPNVLQHLRVSVELERKLNFMVHNGGKNMLTYFVWLSHKFFRGNDGLCLRAECVRYCIFMVMDPQKVPQTSFDNRIQLIHLLITTIPPCPEQQWMKLCLFADWFGCDEKNQQNFASIDVALGVVRYALFLQPAPHQNAMVQPSHGAQFANSLLEFVCKSVDTLLPSSSDIIRKNVNNAMKYCRERFQNGLPQILENSKIDRRVAELIRNTWPDFVRGSALSAPPQAPRLIKKRPIDEQKQSSASTSSSEKVVEKNSEKPVRQEVDEEDEKSKQEKEKIQKDKKAKEDVELNSTIKLLRGEIRTKMEALKNQWKEFDDDADKCEAIEAILEEMLKTEENFDETQQEYAAQCLQGIMGPVVTEDKSLLPENEKDLSEAFTHPIYSFLKFLCSPPDDEEESSDTMTNMMAAMREKDSSLTYVFLYFIKGTAGARAKDCIECYKNVAKMTERTVEDLLATDLQMCAINDHRLFAHLIPFVFSQFEEEVSSTPALLKTLCANVDGSQLGQFISEIIREEFKLFRKETFSKMVMDSVEWPSTPQFIFWNLINADGVPIEWFLSTIPKLDAALHEEAIANILLMMKRMDREPWAGLIRALFNRIPAKDDTFTVDALKVLIEDSEQCQKVAELVGQLIKKLLGNNDILGIGVRVHKKGNPLKLTLQQVLDHLQLFSTTCLEKKLRVTEAFMARSHMQEAFSSIKSNDKATVLLKKYGNLFGAMDIIAQDSKESSSRTLRGNRQGSGGEKQPTPQKRKTNDVEDDQNNKKRKLNKEIIELSDSDSD